MNRNKSYEYDIVLSFAGEDRSYASQVADILTQHGVSVFYDEYEQSELWGKNLYDHLADVYTNKGRYCIMFLSANYARKAWTNHERQNAQARAFREHREYILPVRLDDTEIPGIPETVGFLDLRKMTVDAVAQAALAKLGKTADALTSAHNVNADIPMPKIKGRITQRNRDRFVQETYGCIRDYFKRAIALLERQGSGVEADIQEIHAGKFIAKVYVNGERKSQCKVWVGGISQGNSVAYSESSVDMNNDNSMNDWLSVEEANGSLSLKASGLWFHPSGDNKMFSQEEGAEYYWKRFIGPLER
jgi:hypothetical protein